MRLRTYTAAARVATVMAIALAIVALFAALVWVMPMGKVSYGSGSMATTTATSTQPIAEIASSTPLLPPPFIVTHISAPETVKGVYYTSWAAGTPSFQKGMWSVLDDTDVNSIVIDVKDYSGRISFEVSDPDLKAMGSVQKRIPDIERYIGALHDKGIYVIARVAVFQDPFAVKVHPEWAVHDKNTGNLWKDSGGAYWLDPDSQGAWKYIVAIAKESYSVGFDEINFDYVRFPSDGIASASFTKHASTTKAMVIKSFFEYLHDELSPLGIPISADLFGQTTSDKGDMGIGQVIENAMPYFDYIDPMVYPSHYINGYLGFPKPATHPYEVVNYEMKQAVARSIAASSSPAKMRPWLQAFDLGAIYTPEMVRQQMAASDDAGASGWLLWNAGSVYKRGFVVPGAKAPVAAKTSTSTVPNTQ